MQILMIILIAIGSLIALVLILALFAKKSYGLEREITINKPKQQVFDYIKQLKNQNNYSVWNKMDPNIRQTYTGTDGTVGFISAWVSDNKNVGEGAQEITKIVEGSRLESELRFVKPFKGVGFAYMTTEAAGDNQTKVKWGFNSKMNYPMNFMLLFMNMDNLIGKDYQTGLNELKSILEK